MRTVPIPTINKWFSLHTRRWEHRGHLGMEQVIKRIRRMEMKWSWMPEFDGHNQDKIHMHTYVIRLYLLIYEIYIN